MVSNDYYPFKAESALISLERFQKLELLIHLITNLNQSLVLCGPEGIGKTRLIEELAKAKKENWDVCLIEGKSNLSYEEILIEISVFFNELAAENKNHAVDELLNGYEQINKKLVLVIDDAGKLIPGLVSTLVHFASSLPGLCLIFSMTLDEVHLKTSSDQAINDCHFIEVPPLTEAQCRTFLQNLSKYPEVGVSFKAVTDRMVERLYRETHGIPGEIIKILPELSHYHGNKNITWISLVLVLLVLVVVGGYNFLKERKTVKSEKQVLLIKTPETIKISKPVVQYDVKTTTIEELDAVDQEELSLVETDLDSAATAKLDLPEESNNQPDIEKVENVKYHSDHSISDKSQVAKKKAVINFKQKELTDKASSNLEKAAVSNVTEKIVAEKPQQKVEKQNGTQWLMAHSKDKLTIQIIVLSELLSVEKFLEKNRAYLKQLHYFSVRIKGKQQYVVVYGAFDDIQSAKSALKNFPVKYRKSWIRKFSSLQAMLNSSDMPR